MKAVDFFHQSQISSRQQACSASLHGPGQEATAMHNCNCFLTGLCPFSVSPAACVPQRTSELVPDACYAQVLPDSLMGSKLLHQALGTVLLAARGQLAISAETLLLGVHVVSGALSLSRVRKLFPIDTCAEQMHKVCSVRA